MLKIKKFATQKMVRDAVQNVTRKNVAEFADVINAVMNVFYCNIIFDKGLADYITKHAFNDIVNELNTDFDSYYDGYDVNFEALVKFVKQQYKAYASA